MNIIETENLSRQFGSAEAVSRLSLTIPTGCICALLGANGAGKTTTLKLLMNLLAPTSGTARVLGVESQHLGEKECAQIGYVSENQRLPLWMTVRQLLDYCRPFYPTWDLALEKDLLGHFELPDDRKLKHLSRGMLMKTALLSSLAYRPKLLVLDEPFSGLDPLVREEFTRGLLEVSSQGECTVLVSSHDIEEVERLADRVAFLDHGRLLIHESTETLQGRFRSVELIEAKIDARPAHSALDWRQTGHLTKFVETQYTGETTERMWHDLYGTSKISSQPMNLREIFVAFARAGRAQKGAAA